MRKNVLKKKKKFVFTPEKTIRTPVRYLYNKRKKVLQLGNLVFDEMTKVPIGKFVKSKTHFSFFSIILL